MTPSWSDSSASISSCSTPGWLTHLVADGIWDAPKTMLWPAFGNSFEATPADAVEQKLLSGDADYSLVRPPSMVFASMRMTYVDRLAGRNPFSFSRTVASCAMAA